MPFVNFRISDGITLMQETGVAHFMRCNIWLVEGRDFNLVVDTGMGLDSLSAWIGRETDRPIKAVTTHSHFDHAAGFHEFEFRLGHPAEADVLAAPTQDATVYTGAWKQITIVDPKAHPDFDPETFTVTPAPLTGILDEGDVLDLGNRAFRILHLPGHSPGSIGLWDMREKILFSGDALYDGELLDTLYHSDPDTYRETLIRIRSLDVEAFHAGHFASFGRDRMQELVADYLEGRNTITDVIDWYRAASAGGQDLFALPDRSRAPLA